MDTPYDLPPGVRLRDLVRVEREVREGRRVEQLTVCRFEPEAQPPAPEVWRREGGGPWERTTKG